MGILYLLATSSIIINKNNWKITFLAKKRELELFWCKAWCLTVNSRHISASFLLLLTWWPSETAPLSSAPAELPNGRCLCGPSTGTSCQTWGREGRRLPLCSLYCLLTKNVTGLSPLVAGERNTRSSFTSRAKKWHGCNLAVSCYVEANTVLSVVSLEIRIWKAKGVTF